MLLSQIAQATKGALHNAESDLDVCGFSTDTRSVEKDDMFIALRGDNYDGHDFIDSAVEKNAAAVMVDALTGAAPLVPAIVVDDTLLGLGDLAHAWNKQFELFRVAITGNSGKTTVKEMVAAIFSDSGKTVATLGNKNNEIGVPLTLLRINDTHQYGVFELGANHPGEIAYTVSLVEPDVALVTNVTGAHLEGFGDLKAIAKAKAEIFSGLGSEGIAIVNADDQFADYWLGQLGGSRVILFSIESSRADVLAKNIVVNENGTCSFVLCIASKDFEVELNLLGKHNVANACAAIAVALAAGIDIQQAVASIERIVPVKGRLTVYKSAAGSKVIDDTYNANPGSIIAAIDVLKNMPGKRVLVLGEMGELGSYSEVSHENMAKEARLAGLEGLLLLGQWAERMKEIFGAGAQAFKSMEDLLRVVEKQDCPDTTILVKGSRSAGMERVVEKLLENTAKEDME